MYEYGRKGEEDWGGEEKGKKERRKERGREKKRKDEGSLGGGGHWSDGG